MLKTKGNFVIEILLTMRLYKIFFIKTVLLEDIIMELHKNAKFSVMCLIVMKGV